MKLLASLIFLGTQLCYSDTIVTRTGDKIDYLKISKILPDGVSLIVDHGIKKVPFESLTDADRMKFELAKEAVDLYRGKVETDRSKVEEQLKLATEKSRQEKTTSNAKIPESPERVLINPLPLMQLIQAEEAIAGGTIITGADRVAGPVYTKGKWKGKSPKQLVEFCIVQFASRYGYRPVYEEGAPIGGWKNETAKAQSKANKTAQEQADNVRNAAIMEQQRLEEMQRDLKDLKSKIR